LLNASCRTDESKSTIRTGTASNGGVPIDPKAGSVDLPGVYNARDPGGLPTDSGKRVRRGALYRSGHLAGLSQAGCERLTQLGIKTILDVRSEKEARNRQVPPCVSALPGYRFVGLPKYRSSIEGYARTLDALEPKLSTVFKALGEPGSLAGLVPCMVGRDRASLVMAVLLLSLGVPQARVAEDFVRNRDPKIGVEKSWLEPLFERVQAAGGIDAYLHRHGVEEEVLLRFREAALE